MASRFTSTVKLYHVSEIGNGRFPAFSSISNQTQFFTDRLKATINNCKLVRGRGSVRVNVPTKSFYKDINYLSYVNPDYDNKTMYGFVTGYQYINDQCTELSFVIDFIQTFMFDVECVGGETSIEREHLSAERKQLAETNPFNASLWELETAEPLPMNENLEKRGLAFGHDNDATDSFRLFSGTEGSAINIIYVSQFDFVALDELAPEGIATSDLPSHIWQDFIDHASTWDSLGFSVDFDGSILCGSSYLIPSGQQAHMLSYFTNTCAILGLRRSKLNELINHLTRWGCVSNIVNVVSVPENIITRAFFSSTAFEAVDVFVPDSGANNEKLYRFPYQYIRLITPDYNKKELRYEWFNDINDGSAPPLTGFEVQIGIGTDIINGVSFVATPLNYHNSYVPEDSSWAVAADTSESVIYDNIPTAPYNIDAYLTEMSSLAQQRARTDTLTNAKSIEAEMYGLGARTQQGYAVTEGFATMLGGSVAGDLEGFTTNSKSEPVLNALNIPAVAQSVMEAGIKQSERQLTYDAKITDLEVTANAAAYLVGDDQGIFAQNYRFLKGTYASDHYVQPSGGGFKNFTQYGFLNIMLQRVRLRDEILEMYDNYFDTYGYASGRTGIPYIMKFIDSTITSDSPQWVNGETYVKTNNIHFKGTFQYVCELWAQTFNAGIHWINGDDLITVT